MNKDCKTLLLNVYQTLYGESITMANLNELAETLSQIAQRDRVWTGKFLHSLLKGYDGFKATPRLTEALLTLTRRLKREDEVTARATAATILAVHTLPDQTIILGQARLCAALGCHVHFVATHPRQKYHSKTCARSSRKR